MANFLDWLKAEDHILKNKETFKRRMKYIKPNLKSKKNIFRGRMFIGIYAFPLIKKGFKCTGIEPSGVFSRFLKSKKINVYSSIEKQKKILIKNSI